MPKWTRKWKVAGTDREWTVAQAEDGTFGCSCPRWKFKREECHHITQVRANPEAFASGEPPKKLEIIPGNVEQVTVKEVEGIGKCILHPLIPIGENPGLLATVVFDLLGLGYSMGEVRARFWMIPKEWTVKAVRAYIQDCGRTVVIQIEGGPFGTDTRYVQVGV